MFSKYEFGKYEYTKVNKLQNCFNGKSVQYDSFDLPINETLNKIEM